LAPRRSKQNIRRIAGMSNELKIYAIVTIAGYICGSVSWAMVIGRLRGVDIRKEGSGNPGATNVTRVLGKKWGVLCFFLDFLKGLAPTLAAMWILSDKPAAAVCAGAASVAGHMWPVFLKFKGGKGVSTTAGALAALAPLPLLVSGAVWVLVFKLSRYVSLASITAASALPLSAFALDATEITPKLPPATIAVLTALATVSILKHAGNIKRLVNGTENKFGKKKGEIDESGGA